MPILDLGPPELLVLISSEAEPGPTLATGSDTKAGSSQFVYMAAETKRYKLDVFKQ